MGQLVIIGSGETAPTMMRLHREVLQSARPQPKGGDAVMLDTPFGFQVNADGLVDRTLSYFRQSVGVELEVVRWRDRDAPILERERALRSIQDARWVFAGPGSPSFALRQWADTPIPQALEDVVTRGGTLVVGSAAAVLVGTHSVPVYEIYKAGAEPSWLAGLDLLGHLFGLRAAVIPHFNNAEGGWYDTRFCYLGEQRLEHLETCLPPGTGILGVDEHTALLLDRDQRSARVDGAGAVTVRSSGTESRLESGSILALEELAALLGGDVLEVAPARRPGVLVTEVDPEEKQAVTLRAVTDRLAALFDRAVETRDRDGALAAVLDLQKAIEDWSNDMLQSDDLDYARASLRGLTVRLVEIDALDPLDRRALDAALELLLEQRSAARARGDYALGDRIRDALADVRIEIRDTADGAQWRRQ